MGEESSNTCRNCGTKSELNYCPACGQRISVHKVTFKETFEDLADALFTLNAPLLNTFRKLIVSPGVLLRNFLGGQRKRYYKPVSFFLLTTVIYLVVRSLIGFDPFRNSMITVQEGPFEGTGLNDARKYFLLNINNFLFLFVFTLALFSKLFFFKKYSLAEFLAISFYLVGVYTLLVTINMFFIQYIGDQFQPLAALVMLFYFNFAMCSLFKRAYFLVVLKSTVVFFLAWVLYFLFSFGLSYIIVSFN